jgi:hypothetical protein
LVTTLAYHNDNKMKTLQSINLFLLAAFVLQANIRVWAKEESKGGSKEESKEITSKTSKDGGNSDPTASPTPLSSTFPSSIPSNFVSAIATPSNSILPPTSSSDTPSMAPTTAIMGEVVASIIPIITIDILLSDEDAASVEADDIDSLFTVFMNNLLDRDSGSFDFDYSHLISNIIVSPFNGHRQLGIGYSIQIDGTVYYFNEAPSRKHLSQSLHAYFSFWGAKDIEEHFQRHGLESTIVESIAIDETPIKLHSSDTNSHDTTGSGHEKVGASVQKTSTTAQGNDQTTMNSSVKAAVIALYLAVFLLIPPVLLAMMHMRRRRTEGLIKKNNDTLSCTDSNPLSGDRKVNSDHNCKDDEDESLSGLISAEVSLCGGTIDDDHGIEEVTEYVDGENDDNPIHDINNTTIRLPDV